jgi:hypothetical protein
MAVDANRETSANGRQAPTPRRKKNQIAECPVTTGFLATLASERRFSVALTFPKFKALEKVSEKQNRWYVYKLCFGHDD